MKFCPNCGAALDSGALFCGECGTRIEEAATAPAPPKASPKTPPSPAPKPKAAPVGPPRKASKPSPKPPAKAPPRRAAPAPPVDRDATPVPAPIEPDEGGAGLTVLGVVGMLVANALLFALVWGASWGTGALFVFYDLSNPIETLIYIGDFGFTTEDLDFAAAALVFGVLGGAAAGVLMAVPFAGVFAAGLGRLLIVVVGWFLVMALSRYAAIAFNFYLPEHIVAYFALAGFVLGGLSAATLSGRKPGGMVLRILGTGLIWAAAAGLARLLVIAAIGL